MTLIEAYTYLPPELLVIAVWMVAFALWMDVKKRGEWWIILYGSWTTEVE